MAELRLIVDELETLVAKKYWPLPSYARMLYSVV
jgi:glutamine synthetase